MSKATDRLDRMISLVRRYRPRLRLVDRNEVRWFALCGEAMRPVVGEVNRKFTTVLGDTVYLPGPVDSFDREHLAAVLAHELVHQLDQQQFGPWFYLSYGIAAPAVRTARAMWERRAYAVDLMLAFERGGSPAVLSTLDRLVDVFAGPSYGFMWAGQASARAYLQPIADEVLQGTLARRAPYDAILAAWRGEDEMEGV
ncbi:MAG: hypothetical protein AB8H79_26445 [Myxococcota bacterium]